MKNLFQLLHCICVLDAKNPCPDRPISGLAYHSNKVEDGFLFVAIPGAITDGHKYAPMAAKKGAAGLIVEHFIDFSAEDSEFATLPQYLVSNARSALADLACFYYDNPSSSMHVTGVTATNGKTSSVYMLDHMYQSTGYETGMVGTVVIKIGDESIPSDLTTPESLDLQKYLSFMRDKGVTKVCMEVSSSALELGRIRGVDFDAVSFGNFSREHIDQHGSLEAYWNAKSSLIKNAKQEAVAILNDDQFEIRDLQNHTSAIALTYSMVNPKASFYCKNLDLSSGRGFFTFVITHDISLPNMTLKASEFPVALALPGYHSVINAMSAISLALTDGVAPQAALQSLLSFKGVERRFQYIFEKPFIIVDDHFANAQNIHVTFTTLQHMTYAKLHLVYAIRGNRGPTVNRENALMVAKWKERLGLTHITATLSWDAIGPKDTVQPEEEAIFLDEMTKANIHVDLHQNLRSAVSSAIIKAKEGDVILLAGCQGMDKGAIMALETLHQIYPDIPEEQLFDTVKNRIC